MFKIALQTIIGNDTELENKYTNNSNNTSTNYVEYDNANKLEYD
jgi:hypothetical protein